MVYEWNLSILDRQMNQTCITLVICAFENRLVPSIRLRNKRIEHKKLELEKGEPHRNNSILYQRQMECDMVFSEGKKEEYMSFW